MVWTLLIVVFFIASLLAGARLGGVSGFLFVAGYCTIAIIWWRDARLSPGVRLLFIGLAFAICAISPWTRTPLAWLLFTGLTSAWLVTTWKLSRFLDVTYDLAKAGWFILLVPLLVLCYRGATHHYFYKQAFERGIIDATSAVAEQRYIEMERMIDRRMWCMVTDDSQLALGEFRGYKAGVRQILPTRDELRSRALEVLKKRGLFIRNDIYDQFSRIVFRKSSISDVDLYSLMAFAELEQLDLEGQSDVTDAAIEFLVRHPQLHQINLKGTSVTEDGIAMLRQARPSGRITW